MRTAAVVLLVSLTFAACSPATIPTASVAAAASPAGPSPIPAPASTIAATSTLEATASPLSIVDAKDCPVTKPVKAPADFGDRLFGSSSAFGNEDLWVGGLGDDGVILADPRFVESDGSIGWKFGWWRIASGTLTITGRRLDAPKQRLSAQFDDYGS